MAFTLARSCEYSENQKLEQLTLKIAPSILVHTRGIAYQSAVIDFYCVREMSVVLTSSDCHARLRKIRKLKPCCRRDNPEISTWFCPCELVCNPELPLPMRLQSANKIREL
ncbi:hypothetical protein BC936DRAFT_138536 [Jimgerdemannia flammicorona]|uniref:Uncharacterized protein n=1 Tax=Jimgerdemannia flammicorona TaxID=994334 RepID=A0A433C6Z2_9FUNG|nr:hypothetical protein BC936DRAFT_138536 [Jimgerdemannia flammicorona]